MTLRDLIDQLTEIADNHGDDIEVKLALQPRYPFEHEIGTIALVDEENVDAARCVYIGEGGQQEYLNGMASRALGWR